MTQELLGQRLIRNGLISPEQLAFALSTQKSKGGFLGDILIGLGALTEAQFQRCFAEANGVSFFPEKELMTLQVQEDLFRGVPYQVALNHMLLPLRQNKDAQQLELICLAPLPENLTRQLKFQTQSKKLICHLSTRMALFHAIRYQYSRYLKRSNDQFDPRRSPNPQENPQAWAIDNLVQSERDGFCPRCGHALSAQARICPQCEHLLEHPAQDPLLGQMLEGKWKLVKRLGEGGMGMVYSGYHIENKLSVAIKLLRTHANLTEKLVQRFYHEAQILKQLKHPNIINVYRFGFEPSIGFYLVMELLEGCSLDDFIMQDKHGVSLQKLCHVLGQVCEGMEYAHNHKVIHRDLKPENIFIMEDANGEIEGVKVLDFGIAKNQDEASNLTQTGMTMGTPRYLSPEQAMGSDVERRSDIYTICVILFETLTGEGLFKAESPYQFAMRHVYDQPPTLQQTRPDLRYPGALQQLLEYGLSKRIYDRPDSMKDVHAYLKQAVLELHGEDINIQYSEESYFLEKKNRKEQDELTVKSSEHTVTNPNDPPSFETPPGEYHTDLTAPPTQETPEQRPKQEVIRRPQNEEHMRKRIETPSSRHDPFLEVTPPRGRPQRPSGISKAAPSGDSIPTIRATRPRSATPFPPTRPRSATPFPPTRPGQHLSSDSLPILQGILLSPPHTLSKDTPIKQPKEKTPSATSKIFLFVLVIVLATILAVSYNLFWPQTHHNQGIGFLDINCIPKDAQILIGDKTKVNCPIHQLPLTSGPYNIKITHKGYLPYTIHIDIKPSSNHKLRPKLIKYVPPPPKESPQEP